MHCRDASWSRDQTSASNSAPRPTSRATGLPPCSAGGTAQGQAHHQHAGGLPRDGVPIAH
eukprot:5079200-Pleurochrysis_carterae.AAC.3